MNGKNVEIIVAVDERGGFGKAGKIPWHLPEDLKNFQEVTKGQVCVMGRRTYNDMLDMRVKRLADKGLDTTITEILPGRECYVVTSSDDLPTPGATRVKSLGSVRNKMKADPRTLFAIGGERIFTEALAWCNTIHMTVIKGNYECDVSFPVQVLNKKFSIISGKQTDDAYYVVYQRR